MNKKMYDNYDLLDLLNKKGFDAFPILENEYNIKVNQKGSYYLFKYNQINTPKCHLSNQCRGSIFFYDKISGKFNYVCRPFYRFFNYGEEQAEKIDWESAIIQEKCDGSIGKFWYHNDQWNWSTNGTIDAKEADVMSLFFNEEDNNIHNFFDLINYTLVMMNIDYGMLFDALKDYKDYTHMFELCTIYNKVVVHHKEPKLYYLCSKNNSSGGERTFNSLSNIFPTPKTYSFSSLNEVIEMAKTLPYDKEGYVVKDKYNHRVKVKSGNYLVAHKLKGEGDHPTPKNLLELIRTGETEEVLTYFPEWTESINILKEKYTKFLDRMISDMADFFDKGDSFETRKELALWVKDNCLYPPFIFNLVDGKCSDVRSFLNDERMTNEKILKIMERMN